MAFGVFELGFHCVLSKRWKLCFMGLSFSNNLYQIAQFVSVYFPVSSVNFQKHQYILDFSMRDSYSL